MRDRLVRRGIALEVFTLVWMTVEAAVAVAAGVAAGSVALVAFGIDSVIELFAAFVVLRTFRAEQSGRTDRREEQAVRAIGVTFFLLAAYIVSDAAYTLITASKPDSSLPGIVISAAALAVMPLLSALKRRTGTSLGSQMLLADAAESLFLRLSICDCAGRPPAERSLRLVVGRPPRGARDRAAGSQGRPGSVRA
jgi:divalent metal cation (Fe/Co/Zn/Cd) transporter